MNNLTVLIPTSPIPSHPSTGILDETIRNIRKYTDARIIILFDGVHASLLHRKDDYMKYIENVISNIDIGAYGECRIMRFVDDPLFDLSQTTHRHQAKMTRAVLGIINTSLTMFVEHDTSPIGDIPFKEICDIICTSDEINCVRFNIFDKIPDEHQYLMLGQKEYNGIPLTRTIQWSQRPHIAKTNWYRDILSRYFQSDQRTMIEDVMHSIVQVEYNEKGEDAFGLAIYTPEGNQLRSYHSDGRGSDEKIITG